MWSFKELHVKYFIYFSYTFTPAEFQIDNSMLEMIPKLNVPDKFSYDRALADSWLTHNCDESPSLRNKLKDLVHLSTSWNVMFYSTQHISVIARVRIQVIKGLNLISMLEIMLAFRLKMVFQNNKLFTFMLSEFSLQR